MKRVMFRERGVAFLALLGLSFFFVIVPSSLKRLSRESVEEIEVFEKVSVFVSGAVVRPGTYEVEVGTSLGDILKVAQFKTSADKKALYLGKIMLNSSSVYVPEKSIEKNKSSKKKR